MKTREVIEYLNYKFLPKYQESYDNAGFLLGDLESEYKGALVTVDITPNTVDEAISNDLSLIVSHHPLIFTGMKRITNADETGRMVTKLIKNNISVYAAHTNLDNLDWGINGILAEKLNLINCHILRPIDTQTDNIGAGMIGHLPHPMPLMDFLTMVKEKLGLPVIRTSQLPNEERNNSHTLLHPETSHISIQKVAICGGSGSFLISDAKREGADIYMTGDLKYHDFQRAEDNLILADIGHYESEQFAKEIFYRVILEKFRNFACQISEQTKSYIYYI